MWFLLCLPLLQAAKTGIIRGTVTSLEGEPIRYAKIRVNNPTHDEEHYEIVSADETGRYEVRGLAPGSYHVFCSKLGYVGKSYKEPKVGGAGEEIAVAAEQTVEHIDCALPRAGLITGTVTDEHGEPLPRVMVKAMVKTYRRGKPSLGWGGAVSTDDRGYYRLYDLDPGRYYVQADAGNNFPEAYTAVLYPNASRMADAEAILLAAGQEIGGINIGLRVQQTYAVAGKVFDQHTGRPALGASVYLRSTEGFGRFFNAETQKDGSFKISRVIPGGYQIFASITEAGSNRERNLFRFMEVSGNVSDLTLAVGAGVTIKGRLKAEGDNLPERLSVSLLTAMPDSDNAEYVGSGTTRPDGTFEINQVSPGSYRIWVEPTPQDRKLEDAYFVDEVKLGGREESSENVTIPEGAGPFELSATLDFRTATITGNLADGDDKPLAGTAVVLLHADPKLREQSWRLKQGRTDAQGAFKVEHIPPGDYLLIPWPEAEAGALLDPDVMQQAQKYAAPITVERSSSTVKDLKLAPELAAIARTFAK